MSHSNLKDSAESSTEGSDFETGDPPVTGVPQKRKSANSVKIVTKKFHVKHLNQSHTPVASGRLTDRAGSCGTINKNVNEKRSHIPVASGRLTDRTFSNSGSHTPVATGRLTDRVFSNCKSSMFVAKGRLADCVDSNKLQDFDPSSIYDNTIPSTSHDNCSDAQLSDAAMLEQLLDESDLDNNIQCDKKKMNLLY